MMTMQRMHRSKSVEGTCIHNPNLLIHSPNWSRLEPQFRSVHMSGPGQHGATVVLKQNRRSHQTLRGCLTQTLVRAPTDLNTEMSVSK